MPREIRKQYFAPLSPGSSLGISIVIFTIDSDFLKQHIEKMKTKPSSEAREQDRLIREMKKYLEERGATVHRVHDALYAQGYFTSTDRWNPLRMQAERRCMNIHEHSGTSLPDPIEPDPQPSEQVAPPKRRGRPRGRTGKVGQQQP